MSKNKDFIEKQEFYDVNDHDLDDYDYDEFMGEEWKEEMNSLISQFDKSGNRKTKTR